MMHERFLPVRMIGLSESIAEMRLDQPSLLAAMARGVWSAAIDMLSGWSVRPFSGLDPVSESGVGEKQHR
ncbi:hypothetical protein NITLEN_11034 [Nitrospira lenta]|uniref:Uncharacterized protein n=1 Tax=Nitrospira lenta TaxID=1436998 RepID=A0A330L2G0_9BACT|nr:hypothetical protein NITLEN_11034 [Nitrospira lenta]